MRLKKSPLNFQSLTEIISFHENHDSISKFKDNNIIQKESCFKDVSSNEVKKIIKSLNKKNSAISSCIPVSVLIDSMDIYLPLLADIIDDSLKRRIFPDELKLAEVIPFLKKADPFDKTNYLPVSLLSHISKVFERMIYNQINEYIEPSYFKLLTGFRRKYDKQHSL